MPVLPIVTYPAPVLREKSEGVTEFDEKLSVLVEDMVDTMFDAPGIGLAANQVGVPLRVAVVDAGSISERDEDDDDESGDEAVSAETTGEESEQPDRSKVLRLINPQIVAAGGYTEFEEGCLSIPGIRERVKRRAAIEVSAFDLTGKPFTMQASGLLAVCIQHEIDHLDGVLFIDRLTPVRRELVKGKLKRLFPGTKSNAR